MWWFLLGVVIGAAIVGVLLWWLAQNPPTFGPW